MAIFGTKRSSYWSIRLGSVARARKGKVLHIGLTLESGATIGFRETVLIPVRANGQLLSVTYLDEKPANDNPRAIGVRILEGPKAGWENHVSADWLGPWLFFPLGVLGAITFLILSSRNTVKDESAPEEPVLTGLGL